MNTVHAIELKNKQRGIRLQQVYKDQWIYKTGMGTKPGKLGNDPKSNDRQVIQIQKTGEGSKSRKLERDPIQKTCEGSKTRKLKRDLNQENW